MYYNGVRKYFKENEFGCVHQIASFLDIEYERIKPTLVVMKKLGQITTTMHKGSCELSTKRHPIYYLNKHTQKPELTPSIKSDKVVAKNETIEVEYLKSLVDRLLKIIESR